MSSVGLQMPEGADAPDDDRLELRDVTGPSALGGGWRRSWDLLYLIATTEFKRTYFGTVLGYLWSLGRPLLLFGVLLAVFTQAFHLQNGVQHYPVLLLMNIVLFGFFQESTTAAVPSIVAQESIVRKTQFPRLVIPVAVVLTSLFNLVLNLVVTFAFIAAFGISPRWSWLLIIVTIVLLLVLSTAVSMILSSLYPRFRDLGIIWSVSATALFYGTPVLYALERVSPTMRHIVSLNPLAPILELARRWVIDPHAPTPAALAGGTVRMLVPIGIYVIVCVAAVVIFRREAPRIAEAL
ncbi:MAG TPA: ABC transporter permease [Solirubrobacteraceae bacterium]|nr:ABC transporter permease [Solirubrobacteraceae bacterium]